MNFVAIFMTVFSVLGALDRILGNHFGLGKQFEKGLMMLGTMALSMIGMIVISPIIADLLEPFFSVLKNTLHIDPSIIPASIFANDMGGASLATDIAQSEKIGKFNALVVSSMMGCTVSFTIPYGLGAVGKEHHEEVLLGFLCGIITIPIGCFAGGLVCAVPILPLIIDLLPLVVFSVIITLGLVYCPKVCIKVFGIFGTIIKILITIGLSLGIIRFLTGLELVKGLATFEEGAMICVNAAAVMSGAFPLMFLIQKLLRRPLKKLASALDINGASALGLVGTLATSMTTFETIKKMDNKGIVINSAFAVSAAFTFAGHLAFTLAFDASYIPAVIIAKLVAGFLALIIAIFVAKKQARDTH